jgi:hypothetical protein
MHLAVQSLFLTNVSAARSGICYREAAAPITKINIRAGSATKVGVPSVFIKRARRVAPVFRYARNLLTGVLLAQSAKHSHENSVVA